jgi:probable rRNA maturation factor
MNIGVTDLQKKFRVNQAALKRIVRFFMEKSARMDPTRNWVECSIVVVGHEQMISLNESVLRHKGTTDVITFTYPTTPGETPGWRGEIVVNIDEASEVARDRGETINRELSLYIAHGCQHLGGADDRTESERADMNRRQNRWLNEAESAKLIQPLNVKPVKIAKRR